MFVDLNLHVGFTGHLLVHKMSQEGVGATPEIPHVNSM